MYNFIVGLFTEENYIGLLEETEGNTKSGTERMLLVLSSSDEKPFIVEKGAIEELIDENPVLSKYPRKELFGYFNLNKFVNPTHNNSNNIGSNSALLSHSPTHFKITKAFIKEEKQYSNGNAIINFSLKKVNAFEKSVNGTDYYTQFPELCNRVATFFKEFDKINPDNKWDLKENDFIVFLVAQSDLKRYLEAVSKYTTEKILKYPTFKGKCDSCGAEDELYMLTSGNTFDLSKGRKYLLRHPTRYKTNLKPKASPENFNVCRRCARQVYDFFEYIKKYKFYRFVFPTTVIRHTSDYKNYSSKPSGILKMLKTIYNRNRFNEFDYVMIITDPKIEDIEFRYVNNFNYILPNENPQVNVRDILIRSMLKELPSKNKKDEITFVGNKRDKLVFLMELNLIFNNALVPSLFETDPSKLIKSLHPFLKLKIIEYNSIIRNFIYFQDASLFKDGIYTKLFRGMLSELIANSNLRDDMKIGSNKMRFFLTIYYKYLNMETNGGDTIMKYLELKEKIQNVENIDLENDFEASYFMGQIFYYLLREYKGKNRLELFTKYTMNVHNMEALKKRLITVLEKYSHNEYIDSNRRFHNLIKNVLAFDFKNSFEDNKIPMYTGYFDNNALYGTKEELEPEKQEEG